MPYVFHVPVEGQLFNIFSDSGEEQEVGRVGDGGVEEAMEKEKVGREELTEKERKDYLDYLVQGKGEI